MKYVLVGLGNIGAKRLALLGERCFATVDPHNFKADYRDLNECDESQYQAVILSVPNKVKWELMDWCLTHGKHVLVEKPVLFRDSESALKFQRTAQRNQVIWYTSYNHRFEPLIMELRQELVRGTIGDVTHGRFFYGNGTVANLTGAWRERGQGVLEDLGCHLLDLLVYLLGEPGPSVEAWSLAKREAKTYDHCILATRDKRFVLEMSFLSWKNNFQIELFGTRGSLHLKGLCKWGPSELTICERVFPSGLPKIKQKKIQGPDMTWARDLEYFEKCVVEKKNSVRNDLWISEALRGVTLS